MGILTFDEFLDRDQVEEEEDVDEGRYGYNPYGDAWGNIHDPKTIKARASMSRGGVAPTPSPVQPKKVQPKKVQPKKVDKTEKPDTEEEKKARRERYAAAGLKI